MCISARRPYIQAISEREHEQNIFAAILSLKTSRRRCVVQLDIPIPSKLSTNYRRFFNREFRKTAFSRRSQKGRNLEDFEGSEWVLLFHLSWTPVYSWCRVRTRGGAIATRTLNPCKSTLYFFLSDSEAKNTFSETL